MPLYDSGTLIKEAIDQADDDPRALASCAIAAAVAELAAAVVSLGVMVGDLAEAQSVNHE